MKDQRNIQTEAQESKGFTNKALSRLVSMDRTEELCLVTAALCAFGSVLASQKRGV